MSFNSNKSVSDWNLKCANQPAQPFTTEYWRGMKNQALRIVEEAKELVEAIEARDRSESVDALADLQVVLSGAIFLSQHNLDGAMEVVCKNNDLKYTNSRSVAEGWAGEIEKSTGESVNVQSANFENRTYYSVHRDSDNKVMKPVGHPKVNLGEFVYGADVHEIFVVQKPACAICSGLIINLTKTLGISRLTILEPFSSNADNEFCVDNELTIGDVAFYNGTTLNKTNYGYEQFDIRRVERWLKKVGAL